jgi:hypothetical protein
MRSARVVSRVISTILECGGAAGFGCGGVAALADVASNITHNQGSETRDLAMAALRSLGNTRINAYLVDHMQAPVYIYAQSEV